MRAPWIRLGVETQLGATSDQRAVITVETAASGAADQLVWTGKDATDAYVRTVLSPGLDGSTYTDGILTVSSGVIAATKDLSTNSIVNDGGIRAGGGGAPTITFGSASGTGPSYSSFAGGDYHGEFTYVPGTSPSSGGQAIAVAFQNALGNTNYDVIFMFRNQSAATGPTPYVAVRNTTGFSMSFGTAPTAGTSYSYSYWVVGR